MSKFYQLTNILKKKATYNVIFGERSNGKTYALLEYALVQYFKNGSQMAYVRRWKEDITAKRAQQLFEGVAANGLIKKHSNGQFEGVLYRSGKFYLCNYDDNGKAIYYDQDVLGYPFAISENEHNKSTSYPNVRTIIFDEFLTSGMYLTDEFVHFMNTISTIVRQRSDVTIFMLGNTVNKFCPYFKEMGLKNVPSMEQGAIDVYQYGNSTLKVAVEYCTSTIEKKASNKYFAFDNPKLNMITGGAWELSIYPHLPIKYRDCHILLTYFILFSDKIFQCEIIDVDGNPFTYIHAKTTPIKEPSNHIIYSLDGGYEMNYNDNIFKPINTIQKKILWFFINNRVFYQDNDLGDTINNFIKICKRR